MVINGTAEGALSKIIEEYNPGKGVNYTWIYEGSKTYCDGIKAALDSDLAYVYDKTNPPKCVLTVRSSDDPSNALSDVVVTTHEMPGNSNQRSIWEHPSFRALSAPHQAAIRTAVDNGDEQPAGLTGNGPAFYTLGIQGADAFQVSQYVFRVNHYIGTRNELAIAYADTNKIYTSAQVITETGATGIYQSAVNGAYSSYPFSVPSAYVLGWLKQTPSLGQAAGNRVVVSIEYWLEAWSTTLYSQKS